MKRSLQVCAAAIIFIILSANYLFAQKIDFNNFTYNISPEAQKQLDIKERISVVSGKYTNESGYFSVDRVIYGIDTAVVVIEYGTHMINHPLYDVYVFYTKNGQHLLRIFSIKNLEADYRKWFDDGPVLAVVSHKVNAKQNMVSIPIYVDGPRCCPENVAFLMFKVDSRSVSLVGEPQKEKFVSIDKISDWPVTYLHREVEDEQPMLIGQWKWFTGEIHNFLPDGSINTKPRIISNSNWKCSEPRKCTIVWGGDTFIDQVTLSPDGSSLSGVNQRGTRITGVKIR